MPLHARSRHAPGQCRVLPTSPRADTWSAGWQTAEGARRGARFLGEAPWIAALDGGTLDVVVYVLAARGGVAPQDRTARRGAGEEGLGVEHGASRPTGRVAHD